MKLHIVVNGKQYEVDVDMPDTNGGALPPYVQPPRTVVQPPIVAAPNPGNGAAPADDKVCRSPMAGVVVKVNTQAGQQIQQDDLLIVLEAMKMETNITAPASGCVKSIEVTPGDAVQVNQVLVTFD